MSLVVRLKQGYCSLFLNDLSFAFWKVGIRLSTPRLLGPPPSAEKSKHGLEEASQHDEFFLRTGTNV